MTRAVLLGCCPWLALLVVLVFALAGLVRLQGRRPQLRRLWQLHADQGGSAQTLSFVLTVPLFIMIMMFIVQVSQLMIAGVVVQYAAFAAARAAVVWMPALTTTPEESENALGAYAADATSTDNVTPSPLMPTSGGMTYRLLPSDTPLTLAQVSSPKEQKIVLAAVLACMPISPSRDVGATGSADTVSSTLQELYGLLVSKSASNGMIPARLSHKLAYAIDHTGVEIRFYHPNSEPPLYPELHAVYQNGVVVDIVSGPYYIGPDEAEFRFNEMGFQDQVTVTVKHDLALLPGPGRLLAQFVREPDGSTDKVAKAIANTGQVYTYPLRAVCTLGNEGEKSAVPYTLSTN